MSTYTDLAPKTLKPVHYNMLILDATGASVKEIAQAVGYTPDGVYVVRQNAVYQRELARMRERIQSAYIDKAVERLNFLVPLALQRIEEILTDPEAPRGMRLKAAQDVLNRVPATSLALRRYASAADTLRVTDEDLAYAREALANMPELQRHVLQHARERVLQELAQIEGALAQAQGDDGYQTGE